MNRTLKLLAVLSGFSAIAMQSHAASLTPEEVLQYQNDLGVTLTASEQQQIADLVKPDVVPQWRTDAEARIEQHRKADLTVQVVDANGDPLEGAQVDVQLKDHDFKFSGVLRVKDLTDADNKLSGISTNRFQEIFQKLYNGAGLNNGLKPRLRNGHEAYLPGFFDWAQSIDMPVRGHLLIWPGNNHLTSTVEEKVVALETLWDGVYHSKKYGTDETTETVAELDAQAGDAVVVVVASNIGNSPVETNVVMSGSAAISAVDYDRINGKGPSVAYWYSDVLSDGTVQVDFLKGPSYQNIVIYHLTPDGGSISLLDTQKQTEKDLTGVTNTYVFSSSESGILIEGISAYSGDVHPENAKWVFPEDKRRRFAHRYFSNSNSERSGWTHDVPGTIAIYGLAFANARVVGEQEAELQEPTLQQELKDQIQLEIEEWASLWPVYEWDVINETRDNHRVQDVIGWDQMAEWFRLGQSNSVLPGCDLLLNEYGVISAEPESLSPTAYTSRRDTMMSHLDIILANGGPMNRIGFQSRMTRGYLEPTEIYDRLDEFGDRYGLPMVATEFEVRAKDTFPVDETLRAQITEETLTTYFSHPLVDGFTAWTYMGTDPWVMCNYDGTVKLNGLVWYYLHRIRYTTDEAGATDLSGELAVRGFKGDYEISVSYNGVDYPLEYTLLSNQTAVVMLEDVNVIPPAEQDLDTWDFDLALDGDALNHARTASSVNGTFLGGNAMGSVSNQMARIAATGVANEGFFAALAGASYTGISNEVIQLSWDVVLADFGITHAADSTYSAQGGFGFRDKQSGNKDNRVLLRYQNNKFQLAISAGAGGGNVNIATGTSSLSNLHIRAVYDFGNQGELGSFRVYTTLDGGDEIEHKPGQMALHSGIRIDEFRVQMQALNGGNNWQVGDYMLIDNIMITKLTPGGQDSPQELYDLWLVDQGYTAETNHLDDANGDGVINLVDYAVGGAVNLPVSAADGAYLNYVHIQFDEEEAARRGLSYAVEQTTDLMETDWSTNDVEYIGFGAGPGEGFITVTNRMSISGTNAFMRLSVGFSPESTN